MPRKLGLIRSDSIRCANELGSNEWLSTSKVTDGTEIRSSNLFRNSRLIQLTTVSQSCHTPQVNAVLETPAPSFALTFGEILNYVLCNAAKQE